MAPVKEDGEVKAYEALRRNSTDGLGEELMNGIWRLNRELPDLLGNPTPLIENTEFVTLEGLVQYVHANPLGFVHNARNTTKASDPNFQDQFYSLFLSQGVMPLAQEFETAKDVKPGDPKIKRLTIGIRTHRDGKLIDPELVYDAVTSAMIPNFSSYLKLPSELEEELRLHPEQLKMEQQRGWRLEQLSGILLPENIFKDTLNLTFGPKGYEERRQFLNNFDEEANARKIYYAILRTAIKFGATDVHVEPVDEERCRVRYRVDGALKEAQYRIPMGTFNGLITVIKNYAKLDIAEKRMPQDGVITFAHRKEEGAIQDELTNQHKTEFKGYSIRVSTIPVLHGEKAVMRFLNLKREFSVERLGYPERIASELKRQLQLPNGLILLTGPTGSGKTTTLYAALEELNKPDINIGTIEDPIEIPRRGINQTQVHPEIGLTFGELIRRYLRQDPDVILIGEIRDPETAKIAMQAAETGHLVLSTLHTNDSTGTLPRLLELDVEVSKLQNFLRCIASQRLVRKLCDHCKEQYSATTEMNKLFQDPNTISGNFVLHRAKPENKKCEHCLDMGYLGRKPVTEIWVPGDEEKELIAQGVKDSKTYFNLAVKNGMLPMIYSGMEMLLDGTTSTAALTFEVPFDDFRKNKEMLCNLIRERLLRK